jgi:hypothetical protein
LSRLGISAAAGIYWITGIAAGVGVLSLFPKFRSSRSRVVPRLTFMFGFLITLLLALYPLLCLREGPTTVSLGNIDPVTYASTSRFLETASIRHPPSCDLSRPLTCLINYEISWHSRPGTFLTIGLLAVLFHLQPYQLITVLLAVVLAMTPQIVGVFVEVVSGNRLAALIALLMSALSVNQLYFFYQGFAAQVLGEGCLIIALIFWWKAEIDQAHWSSYAFMIALAILGTLELYQEDVPLLFIPPLISFVSQFFTAKKTRWGLICRYMLPVGIAFVLDPFAFWYCLAWLWALRANTAFGWPLPRWALPADVVGLMNVYLPNASEHTAAMASVPVAALALWGFVYWRQPRLTLSVISAAFALLLYEYTIRHYSYAYHKFADNLSFLLVGGFATGVARLVGGRAGPLARPYIAGLSISLVTAGCFLTDVCLVEQMRKTQFSVGPDLVELTAIKRLAGNWPIRILEDRLWQQLWAVYFLNPIPILLAKPVAFTIWIHTGAPESQHALTLDASTSEYFTLPKQASSSAEGVTLVLNSTDPSSTPARGRVLWQNSSYLLLGPGDQYQSLRIDGQTPDRWITDEGLTVDIPCEWVRLRPIIELRGPALFFEHLGGKPKVKVKAYFPAQPSRGVPGTVDASADHYTIRVELNSAALPSIGEVHLIVLFDRYFVPQKLGYDSDTRHLVIRMPEEVRLLPGRF